MDVRKCTSSVGVPSLNISSPRFSIKFSEKNKLDTVGRASRSQSKGRGVDVDIREVYFLVLQLLSSGPCKNTFTHFLNELLEHQLLLRRYHSWFSRSSVDEKDGGDGSISLLLSFAEFTQRYGDFRFAIDTQQY